MPELGSRALFPDLLPRAYLNHAAVSPPSLPVRAAVGEVLDRYARIGVGAVGAAGEQRGRVKAALAALLGCESADLALTSSTTDGLIALSCSIPWSPGDRILGFRGEFPANTTPWFQAAAAFGGRVRLLDQEGLSDDAVLAGVEAELSRGGVRLIAVSLVQFSSGRAMPVERIARLAHAHGAEVCVDGIQGVGVMPVDVRALGVDYLAGGAHKWLMGVEGAGYLYVAPHRVADLVPRTAGWLSHEDPIGFLVDGRLTYDRPIRGTTDFFEGHSLSAVSCAALEAAIAQISAIGVDRVQAHVSAYNDALEAGLVERGWRSLRIPGSPSGTLSAIPPEGSASEWAAALGRRGVAVSAPDGKLRMAPHWPNALDEVPEVLAAVDAGLP